MKLHPAQKAHQGLEDQHRLIWKLGEKLFFCLFCFFGTVQLVGYGVPGQNVGWFIIPVFLFVLCRSGKSVEL